MGDKTGFNLLTRMEKIDFAVIFVTAYSQYAIKAFKFSAVDYILKPVDEEELRNAVARVEENLAIKDRNQNIEGLKVNYQSFITGEDKIALKTSSGFVFSHVSEIVRCEADGNKTNCYLKDSSCIVALKKLGDMEEVLLDHNFARVHHSHIVNMSHIKSFQSGRSGILIMSDGSSVEVSQRKKDEFLKKFNKS